MSLNITQERVERRNIERSPVQVFVKIRPIDEEGEGSIGLTTDINDNGMALITYIPLPVGTRIIIDKGDAVATGEITDWDWDCALEMARLGVRFVDKRYDWT